MRGEETPMEDINGSCTYKHLLILLLACRIGYKPRFTSYLACPVIKVKNLSILGHVTSKL